ncbi:hypothetical protein BH23VER1_BH23VER1_09360 [soil metagenome]
MRAEMDAIRIYAAATRRLFGQPAAAVLRSILDEHDECVVILRSEWAAEVVGLPDANGMWATAFRDIQSAGSAGDAASALGSLLRAEEQLLEVYSAEVQGICSGTFDTKVREVIIPRKMRSVNMLKSLIDKSIGE